MSKIFYANTVDVAFNRDGFILTLEFKAPDGSVETMHVAISPRGAKTIEQDLSENLAEYEKQFGKVTAWKPVEEGKSTNGAVYVS